MRGVRGSERIPVLQRIGRDQCVRNLQPVAERIILDQADGRITDRLVDRVGVVQAAWRNAFLGAEDCVLASARRRRWVARRAISGVEKTN